MCEVRLQSEQNVVCLLSVDEMRSVASRIPDQIMQKLIDGSAHPTFLRVPPQNIFFLEGQETVVIEVGGTNMRCGLGVIQEGKAKITGEALIGNLVDEKGQAKTVFEGTEDFFDHLIQAFSDADQSKFQTILDQNPNLPLSIIFSFPGKPEMTENGSLDCLVTELSKGFEIPGMIDQKFGQLLFAYLKEKNIDQEEREFAIFNDTPILLQSKDNFGIVVSTGFNYAVKMKVEKLRQIFNDPKFAPDWQNEDKMIVNIEAGGMSGAADVLYDKYQILRSINEQSDNCGRQLDEKLISGKYLGQALRLITGDDRACKSEYISNILANKWDNLPFSVEEADKQRVFNNCQLLRDLSAMVVACDIAGTADFLGEKRVEATVEGQVFWKMPDYKEKVVSYLVDVFGFEERNICFKPAGEEGDRFGSLKKGAVAGLYFLMRKSKSEVG